MIVGTDAKPNVISSGGQVHVNGGQLSKTNVNIGGQLHISNNGIVGSTYVSNGGQIHVSSGGSYMEGYVTSQGVLIVSSGGYCMHPIITSGSAFVSGGRIFSGLFRAGTVSVGGVGSAAGYLSYTIMSGGAVMSIDSGGVTSETYVLSGRINVFDGGKIQTTVVSSGLSNNIYVNSGGTALGNTLHSGAKLYVSAGGSAQTNSIGSGAEMYVNGSARYNYLAGGKVNVSKGASVSSSLISAGGSMLLNGSASETKISSGGIFDVNISGVATSTTVSTGGLMKITSGSVNDLTVSTGGSVSMYAGTADVVTIGGTLIASGSGIVKNATVDGKGLLEIKGATASSAIVSSAGSFTVSSGGNAVSATVSSAGAMNILAYGVANGATVSNGGAMDVLVNGSANTFTGIVQSATVHAGTIASDVTVQRQLEIFSGGTANKATANAGAILFVNGGGSAVSASVTGADAVMNVLSGGVADNAIVRGLRTSASILEGGLATNAKVSSGGRIDVYSTGRADSATVYTNGSMNVHADGAADFATVQGVLDLNGTANSATVNAGGRLNVLNGAKLNNAKVNKGDINLSGGTAAGALVDGPSAYLTVFSGGTATGATVQGGGTMVVSANGAAVSAVVSSGGSMKINNLGSASNTAVSAGYMYLGNGGVATNATVGSGTSVTVSSGGKLTGWISTKAGAVVSAYAGGIIDFDLTKTSAGALALVNDLSNVKGAPSFTLTVDGTQADGTYSLASGASGFSQTITVYNTVGTMLDTLTVGKTASIGGVDYTLNLGNDNVLSVTVGAAVQSVARGDRDGNGVSDVMFVWTGEHRDGNFAHGYWMNGSADWWSANAFGVSPDWDNLGSYDMSGDGCADAVMFGNVIVNNARGAYIGYYQDGNDADGWVTIGFLDNAENIEWQNKVGNLTGNASGKNSIVWYAPELYALGVWTDGTTDWVDVSHDFGGDAWTLAGCGDFDGDGRDSALMSYNKGQLFYIVDIDGTNAPLGSSDWRGWEIRAIGDFAGDGKDDIVLFHEETGAMVMCADGNIDSFVSIGQLAANDWFVVGAGDYNGDAKDDLLVRQYSTGMLGYYICADQSQWGEMGRGVGMEWTVIA